MKRQSDNMKQKQKYLFIIPLGSFLQIPILIQKKQKQVTENSKSPRKASSLCQCPQGAFTMFLPLSSVSWRLLGLAQSRYNPGSSHAFYFLFTCTRWSLEIQTPL